MNLLIYDACTFTLDDIMEVLKRHNITCRYILYRPNDLFQDDFFRYRMKQYLSEDTYDAVFSINYYPLLARLCYENHVKYLAWSYDSPLIIPDIEATLSLPTTHFFVFDRMDYEKYRKKGFTNVYHLPLGINTTRLSTMQASKEDDKKFGCDVSLLGQIYESTLPQLLLPLSDYLKGYIQAIMQAQMSVYGSLFLEDVLTDELLRQINLTYQNLGQTNVTLEKHGLCTAIAKQITRMERITLLDTLGSLCTTRYYAHKRESSIEHALFSGSVNYYTEMYKVFKCSKINLNPTLRSIISGIPLRALDILGSGGFLLSNYQPELAEYFADGTDLVLYTSLEDAVDKAMFYLAHDDLRAEIALSGKRNAYENFSYEKQLAVILSVCS